MVKKDTIILIVVIGFISFICYLMCINDPIANAYHDGYRDGVSYNETNYNICMNYTIQFTDERHLSHDTYIESLYSIYPSDVDAKERYAYAQGYMRAYNETNNNINNVNGFIHSNNKMKDISEHMK
jgi:hypothetical protein